jgi:hypothetical protein
VAAASPTIITPQAEQPAPQAPVPEQAVVGNGSGYPWHWLALATSAGWLLTLLWLFLQWRRQRRAAPAVQMERASETRAWGQLLAACASDSPAQARTALLGWVGALQDRRPLTATDQVDRYFRDADMAREIAALNRALYAGDGGCWQGQGLRSAAERLRATHRQDRPAASRLELYPQAAAQGAQGAP